MILMCEYSGLSKNSLRTTLVNGKGVLREVNEYSRLKHHRRGVSEFNKGRFEMTQTGRGQRHPSVGKRRDVSWRRIRRPLSITPRKSA